MEACEACVAVAGEQFLEAAKVLVLLGSRWILPEDPWLFMLGRVWVGACGWACGCGGVGVWVWVCGCVGVGCVLWVCVVGMGCGCGLWVWVVGVGCGCGLWVWVVGCGLWQVGGWWAWWTLADSKIRSQYN